MVKVARLPSTSCPVKLLVICQALRASTTDLSHYFVSARNWVPGTSCDKLRCHILGAREQFRQMISELGLDSDEFGLHRLRSAL